MQEIFRQQTTQDQTIQNKTLQLISFKVGNEDFAIPITDIREIVKPSEYTHIPFVPAYILGVFNLRGNILPLIDLKQKFGFEPTIINSETHIIVAKHQDQMMGFVVDQLTGVLYFQEDEIDKIATQKEESIICGIGKQKDKLIAILEANELFRRDF